VPEIPGLPGSVAGRSGTAQATCRYLRGGVHKHDLAANQPIRRRARLCAPHKSSACATNLADPRLGERVGADNSVRGVSLVLSLLAGIPVGAAKQTNLFGAPAYMRFHARARIPDHAEFGKAGLGRARAERWTRFDAESERAAATRVCSGRSLSTAERATATSARGATGRGVYAAMGYS
jgi:hypothetical protein